MFLLEVARRNKGVLDRIYTGCVTKTQESHAAGGSKPDRRFVAPWQSPDWLVSIFRFGRMTRFFFAIM
jgi:hypothetical protein